MLRMLSGAVHIASEHCCHSSPVAAAVRAQRLLSRFARGGAHVASVQRGARCQPALQSHVGSAQPMRSGRAPPAHCSRALQWRGRSVQHGGCDAAEVTCPATAAAATPHPQLLTLPHGRAARCDAARLTCTSTATAVAELSTQRQQLGTPARLTCTATAHCSSGG